MPSKRNLRKNKRTNRKSKHMKRRLSRKQIGGGSNDFKFILYSNFEDKGPYSSARDYQIVAFYRLKNSADEVKYIDYYTPPMNDQLEIKFRLERTDDPNIYQLIRPDNTVGYLRGSKWPAAHINRIFDY